MAPLNGLSVTDEALHQRRAVGVKIDNHLQARPQSGLEQADAVYELLVEAGLTRFIALFHQSDSSYLGPMRSGRSTDITLFKPLGATMFISGMQPWIRSLWNREDVFWVEDIRPASFRIEERNAPQNLYANTSLLRDEADRRGYPDDPPAPMFAWGDPVTPSGDRAIAITFEWSDSNTVRWIWNSQHYLRFQDGERQKWVSEDSESEGQISADTLVVLFGRQYTAHPPRSGKSVPATETVGTGRALVFAQGLVHEGTWSRETNEEPFTLTDQNGNPLLVPPGIPWISIFPDHRTLSWT